MITLVVQSVDVYETEESKNLSTKVFRTFCLERLRKVDSFNRFFALNIYLFLWCANTEKIKSGKGSTYIYQMTYFTVEHVSGYNTFLYFQGFESHQKRNKLIFRMLPYFWTKLQKSKGNYSVDYFLCYRNHHKYFFHE